MKNFKIIILCFLMIFFTGCSILKKSSNKSKEEYKTEKKDDVNVSKSDSTRVITDITVKNEKDSVHQDVYEGADSIKVTITEEKTDGKTTIKKDITVYRPVKNTTTDSKSEKQESAVTIDSTAVAKSDSIAAVNEKVSSTKQQEDKKEFKWSIPWYVYLGGGLAIVLIIFYFIRRWTSGESLKDMLKKLLGLTKN